MKEKGLQVFRKEIPKRRQKRHFTWRALFRQPVFENHEMLLRQNVRVFFQTKPTWEISFIACFWVIL